MRKFVIHTKTGSIMEVICEMITPLEDVSVMWLNPGEYRARIVLPTSFHQKVERTVEGKKETTMVPDIWCWHAFYDSLEAAQTEADKLVRNGFEFELRKHKKAYTEEDVQAIIAARKVVML